MMDQPSFEREINAYLVKVDGILEGCGLLHEKGSAKLNSVQKEVDMTLDKLRAMQRERRLDRVAIGQITNQSLKCGSSPLQPNQRRKECSSWCYFWCCQQRLYVHYPGLEGGIYQC